MRFNVARINLCTEAEGPHKRMAIWFQGCTIGCPGCCNPELQEMKEAHILSLQEIISIAKKSKEENGIEGVTYLGGESTLQKHLPELSNEFHKVGLGVILFTGYEIKQLKESLISSVDLIIDGQFVEKKLDQNRNLIGSTNQTFNHISNRYIDDMDWFMKKRDLQVEVNISGDLLITGDVVIK
ncbi:MAG: 4Fe-4S cluster-binding domain-containing protein [Bacilli bacterium]|jgi:anaerobic ribonucleoside-triphosphate reductase activating protein|nr:4Fe-4S cluster-binding domain-containing protein [Bacilli bacterium]